MDGEAGISACKSDATPRPLGKTWWCTVPSSVVASTNRASRVPEAPNLMTSTRASYHKSWDCQGATLESSEASTWEGRVSSSCKANSAVLVQALTQAILLHWQLLIMAVSQRQLLPTKTPHSSYDVYHVLVPRAPRKQAVLSMRERFDNEHRRNPQKPETWEWK
ncbi:uncharacterized protein B0I36DRAFT_317769 [Microdochium trichocladiopsis]|uniref:Uncharacterized protein n=1 Tax=Microdochium trichocladiopsis TaxID=1682393 RepID=A0A9P8YC12_9PEZI|nr:uncharacterized protein B0I36DRAFT_317769 [Microdochium trichocladiopsis]KAH7035170.1 hypothetical protein B0I36DRAFT_317769 [Microdochium trichocladiopsis]